MIGHQRGGLSPRGGDAASPKIARRSKPQLVVRHRLLDEDSAGTGTVIRPDTIGAYAGEAGFGRVEVLPIQHDFWRFYRLVP